MLKKILLTGVMLAGLAGTINAQEAEQPEIGKRIEASIEGPINCRDDLNVVLFDTANNGKSFYLINPYSKELLEKNPFLFLKIPESDQEGLKVYIDPERDGIFIKDPFPPAFSPQRVCLIANDLDKQDREIIQQPKIGALKIIAQRKNYTIYQSKDGLCNNIVRYTGYLHENGWAVHEKKKTGEQIQIPYAFLSGLTIYVDPEADGTFDYKTRLDSGDIFCKILEKRK